MVETEKQESIYVDVCFVIDTTESMSYYIVEAKNSIQEIINSTETSLKELYPDIYNNILRVSVIAYRDHPPNEKSYVTKELDFTSSQKAKKFVEELSAVGGGDFPEAVMDGLYSAANKIKWREKSDKILFLILDAPGHGKRFGTEYDCPCGYTEKDFMPFFTKKEVKFYLIKNENNEVLKMIKVFQEYLPIEIKVFQQKETEIKFSKNDKRKIKYKKDKKETIDINNDEIEVIKNICESELCESKKSEMVDFVSSIVLLKFTKNK